MRLNLESTEDPVSERKRSSACHAPTAAPSDKTSCQVFLTYQLTEYLPRLQAVREIHLPTIIGLLPVAFLLSLSFVISRVLVLIIVPQ